MESLITPTNILFVIGLLGTIFTIYNYFRDPQVKSEKMDAITAIQIDGLQKDVKAVMSNHLPHIDQRLNSLHESINTTNQNVVRLATIIDERIPKKTIISTE